MSETLIYKYLPFSINSLKILIKGGFWFGLPKNLNDPFEGEFAVKNYSKLPDMGLVEFYYKEHKELLNGKPISDKIDEIKADISIFHKDLYTILKIRLKEHYGLTSFSYIPNSILLWSYYADAHKGFCIVFDKNLLIETISHPYYDFHDVVYKPNLCEAELILERTKIGYMNEKEILFSKLSKWKHEKEARIITFFRYSYSPRNIFFNKSCIKRIIVGENISKDDLVTLKMLIKNDSKYSNVGFYRAIKDPLKQRMKIEKFNDK